MKITQRSKQLVHWKIIWDVFYPEEKEYFTFSELKEIVKEMEKMHGGHERSNTTNHKK